MSLVYGYDLKENDKIVEAPVQLGNILARLVLPGAALVNISHSVRTSTL
jgi:hypothetical protein